MLNVYFFRNWRWVSRTGCMRIFPKYGVKLAIIRAYRNLISGENTGYKASCYAILSMKHFFIEKKCFTLRIVKHWGFRASQFLA